MKFPATTFLLLLLLSLSEGDAYGQQRASVVISTPEQIKADFAAVPCKDEERLSTAKSLSEKMGAAAPDISVEKYKNVENFIVRRPGASGETAVRRGSLRQGLRRVRGGRQLVRRSRRRLHIQDPQRHPLEEDARLRRLREGREGARRVARDGGGD